MSEASIYLHGILAYVPEFDGYDFDMDLMPYCDAETMEGWL